MPYGNTKTFTVDNVTDAPIVLVGHADEVLVGEDPSVAGWPTQDWKLKMPSAAATPAQKPSGTSQVFKGKFLPGDILGYARTVTSATTFFQIEQQIPGTK